MLSGHKKKVLNLRVSYCIALCSMGAIFFGGVATSATPVNARASTIFFDTFNADESVVFNQWSSDQASRITIGGEKQAMLLSGSNIDDNIFVQTADVIITRPAHYRLSFDDVKHATPWNHSSSYLQIGIQDGLAIRITTYGDGGKLVYNGEVYDLVKAPYGIYGHIAIEMDYDHTNRTVTITQTNGKYKEGGVIKTATNNVLAEMTFSDPIDFSVYNRISISGNTRHHGGYSGAGSTIDNIRLSERALDPEAFFYDSCDTVLLWSGVGLHRVQTDHSYFLIEGGNLDENLFIESTAHVSYPANYTLRFDTMSHFVSFNHSITDFYIGLDDKMGISITTYGDGGTFMYNGTTYSMNKRPAGFYGNISIEIKYTHDERRLQIIQYSGRYKEGSNFPFANPDGTVLVNEIFSDPIDFSPEARLTLSSNTRLHGNSVSTIDNIRLSVESKWPQEIMRGFNSGLWNFWHVEGAAVAYGWGARLLRGWIRHDDFRPRYDTATSRWTFHEDHAWDILDRFLDTIGDNSTMKLIIDNHRHHDYYPREHALPGAQAAWDDPAREAKLAGMWRTIAETYKDHDAVVGYDILNEPHPPYTAEGYAAWNRIVQSVTAAIREVDVKTAIIVQSPGFADPAKMPDIEYTGDPNTIYSFHFYRPHDFAEQGTRDEWPFGDDGESGYVYPGIIPLGWFEKVPTLVDRDFVESAFAGVTEFQRKHLARLFVGEFGAVRWTPFAAGDDHNSTYYYLRDVMEILDREGFDWCMHEFRNSAQGTYSIEHSAFKDVSGRTNETDRLTLTKDFLAR